MPKKFDIKSKESQDEDVNCVNEVLSGNTNAFKFLQKKYQRIVASLIRKMVKNEDDIQDLTQETFIKAYNALSRYQNNYYFSSWLYKIASNTCIDFLRKKRFVSISLVQQMPSSEEEHIIEIEDNSYLPDMNILSNERKKALITAINNLPDNYKLIIKLRHEDDMDYIQISEKLNIPLGTVKAHLFRARKILYNELKNLRHLFNEN